ncbi:hypothetical protein [Azospirillum brasilense]|uniref:Uncharacterized protein n=1 Tax=Azospirillum brasilense TaxID=192 RepID=A0A235HED1_AZOBR|nr:hypothetical protein [Azospirillum brasilense]OYD83824.1 hypothetical protein CHT98_13645 [Azospirillum brasilense]
MDRKTAADFFGRKVPDAFIADTPEAERPEVAAMLEGSKGFFEGCARHQVVAEVVEAERCMAGVRVGQRYVMQGAHLDPAQTTGPVCVFLMGMLAQRVGIAFDRFGREGAVSLSLPGAHCTDPGPAVGGFGAVKVHMWIEPVPDAAPEGEPT